MLLLLILIFILYPGDVRGDSCKPENVSAAEGGEATLHVRQTGVRSISWVKAPDGAFIATTKPGRPIDDGDLIKRYRGRLRSDADGSLHISDLSLQDTGTYRANILNTDDEETCRLFNLIIYERLSAGDISITHSITKNDTCSLSLLCTVDRQDVLITWRTVPSSDINVTQGVLYVPPSGVSLTYTCTAHNPVSNVSKTVIPMAYCQTSISNAADNRRKRYLLFGILGLLPIFCLILLIYLMWKSRRSKIKEVSTTYAQVGDLQRQGENTYQTQEAQSSISVYSEVQHAKKTGDSQKEIIRTAENTMETLYSKVTLPQA